MINWLKDLDRILRGEATQVSSLRDGEIDVPIGGLSVVIVCLAVIYGICMGVFALLRETGPEFLQLTASAVKMPALFCLTLVVTFPSLYVFNAMVGSRFSIVSVLRLLVAAMGVMLAVLASLGPVVTFFSLSTTSYEFMVLLNVLVCAASGALGLTFLLQALNRLSAAQTTPTEPEGTEEASPFTDEPNLPAQDRTSSSSSDGPSPEPTGAGAAQGEAPAVPVEVVEAHIIEQPRTTPPVQPGLTGRPPVGRMGNVFGLNTQWVFNVWVLIFGLVGAQMSWILRPFVGDPNTPFNWFRARESSFFAAVFGALQNLFN